MISARRPSVARCTEARQAAIVAAPWYAGMTTEMSTGSSVVATSSEV
jgi:hypothetical protein